MLEAMDDHEHHPVNIRSVMIGASDTSALPQSGAKLLIRPGSLWLLVLRKGGTGEWRRMPLGAMAAASARSVDAQERCREIATKSAEAIELSRA